MIDYVMGLRKAKGLMKGDEMCINASNTQRLYKKEYVCLHIHMYICVYIHTYIHIYMNKNIYVNMQNTRRSRLQIVCPFIRQ